MFCYTYGYTLAGTAFYSHLYCAGLSLFMLIVWVPYTIGCMHEYAYNLALVLKGQP